jgi:hypothetical protein
VQNFGIVLAAQRSGSARAASSGPTTLPSPRQADNFFFFFFLLLLLPALPLVMRAWCVVMRGAWCAMPCGVHRGAWRYRVASCELIHWVMDYWVMSVMAVVGYLPPAAPLAAARSSPCSVQIPDPRSQLPAPPEPRPPCHTRVEDRGISWGY